MDRKKRQVVSYLFYKIAPEWRRLDRAERERTKADFAAVLQYYARRLHLRTYSTMGMRADADIMLWQVCDQLETLHEVAAALHTTALAAYLTASHSYLAMMGGGSGLDLQPSWEPSRQEWGQAKYLFLCPLKFASEWYLLSAETRQELIRERAALVGRYPSVQIYTACSLGLDDQDFVVAFESNEPAEVLSLVAALRQTEAYRYVLPNTPAFACVGVGIWEMLDALGG